MFGRCYMIPPSTPIPLNSSPNASSEQLRRWIPRKRALDLVRGTHPFYCLKTLRLWTALLCQDLPGQGPCGIVGLARLRHVAFRLQYYAVYRSLDWKAYHAGTSPVEWHNLPSQAVQMHDPTKESESRSFDYRNQVRRWELKGSLVYEFTSELPRRCSLVNR